MYSTSHPTQASSNGESGNGMMDGSGTINPATLNPGVLPSPASTTASHPGQRGVKRSRSPDVYGDAGSGERGDEDESKPRKRGRPPKTKIPESPHSSTQPYHQSVPPPPVQTPQLKGQAVPRPSPAQASPSKSTPTKSSVIKALPTVRDHTTDQLNPEQDEYIPREFDEAGEKKVTPTGHLLDGREYRCRTFYVPNRGEKLFMLATECARVLGYRDSYLLFNKNKSLYKIIATQAEKDDLIQKEILPYSYRSRQIAIVTARSMFRQFGSRVIVNGRRVRDDYWESKARKQGFTEEDAAGEKRPGAAKQREAAAAEASHAHALTSLPHGEIIYSNGPTNFDGHHGIGGINPATLAPLPMINLAPTDDLRPRDYGNVQRPRHEISGPAYQDRIQPAGANEILNQAAQTADFNKALGQQRANRSKYLDDYWKRPHEPLASTPSRQGTAEGESVPPVSQSPQLSANASAIGSGHQNIVSQTPQTQSQLMTPQAYPPQPHAQSSMQTPLRPMHQPMRPDQMHQRSPSIGMGPQGGGPVQPAAYGYPQNQMWGPPPPQHPSPLPQHHSLHQYAQQQTQHQQQQQQQQQQSPHPQPSPLHAPPQLHHPQSSGSMHGAPMQYPTISGMSNAGYPPMSRNPYQPSPTPQQFMQSSAGQQPGLQGWAPGPPAQGQQQGWQGF